jgi:hypothetical protein
MANLYCSTLSPIYTVEDSRSFAVANYPTIYLRSRNPLWNRGIKTINPRNIPENLNSRRPQSGISIPFPIQRLCQSFSPARPNMTADILRIAILCSLNYVLSMLHLNLKPRLDIEDFEDP